MLRRATTDAEDASHGLPGPRVSLAALRARLTRHGRLAHGRGSLFGEPPLNRAAYVHGLVTAGDAFFTVSLAGSLFFNVSFDAARPRILLYLVLTMAPFALVAPLLGPAVDRLPGGPRVVIFITAVGRGVLCLLMAAKLAELLVFPLAFGGLVLGKTYSVARNTLVPRLVAEDRLVTANSLLARLAAIAGGLAGAAAAAVLAGFGARYVLVLGAIAFGGGALMSLRLPRPVPCGTARPDVEWREMHSPLIVLGIGSVTVLRAAVGFLIFLLGISLKRNGEPAWFFGLVIVALGLGSFAGNALAPMARRHLHEERILGFALVVPLFFAVLAVIAANRVGTLLAALGVGAGAAVGRQAFDAVVQRETHELDRGRAFARFDTRFQLAWVLGALLPVLLRPPLRVGFALLAVGLGVGLVLYLSTIRSLAPEPLEPPEPPEPPEDGETGHGETGLGEDGHGEDGHGEDRTDTAAPPEVVLATARRLLDTGDERSAVVLAASAALDQPLRGPARGDPRCARLAALRRQALGEGEPLCPTSALVALDLATDLLRGTAPH